MIGKKTKENKTLSDSQSIPLFSFEELASESLKVSAVCWSWKLIYNSAENSNLWIISNKLTSLLNNQVLHTFQTFVFLYKVSSKSFFSDFSTLLRLLVKGRRVHVQTVAQHKKRGDTQQKRLNLLISWFRLQHNRKAKISSTKLGSCWAIWIFVISPFIGGLKLSTKKCLPLTPTSTLNIFYPLKFHMSHLSICSFETRNLVDISLPAAKWTSFMTCR